MYEDYLKRYDGKLHDWAYDVFKMKPEDIINNHIGIRKNYHGDSYVVINNKAHLIYNSENKKKNAKTFAFFFNLMDECQEIVSLAEDHRNCKHFITRLEYKTKQYVFCALNHSLDYDYP